MAAPINEVKRSASVDTISSLTHRRPHDFAAGGDRSIASSVTLPQQVDAATLAQRRAQCEVDGGEPEPDRPLHFHTIGVAEAETIQKNLQREGREPIKMTTSLRHMIADNNVRSRSQA